jgi:serine/threonine protein kinase
MPKHHFNESFPGSPPEAIDLLDRLLTFNPANRITIEDVIEHPYLDRARNPEVEYNAMI